MRDLTEMPGAEGFEIPVEGPDIVLVQAEPYGPLRPAETTGVEIEFVQRGRALSVDLVAVGGVSRVLLRWKRRLPGDVQILGDAWERTYGELSWRGHQAERPLPWMFLVHDREAATTWGAGVEVRGGAMAFWTVDPHGFSLWLDVRSGDSPVRPGSRRIHAATIHAVRGSERPFLVHGALTGLLCPDPLLPSTPLVGANNYYYAYGKDFDRHAVVRDARTIAELVGDHPVRPYGVVDDGWSPNGTADGRPGTPGPWDRPRRPQFDEMNELADAVRAEGVRPGIWFRPLLRESLPAGGHGRARDGAYAMDPSDPAALEIVSADVSRFVNWGFEFIKHDFSTWDAFGRWGSAMGASITGRPWQPATEPHPARGWEPADVTRTNAEVIVDLYRTIREAAGDAVILGCNVIGHLAAGNTHAQRIGDDTSGLVWERTRRVGVNTLAFRLAQHGRFFVADADCVPSTRHTDWAKNRQFLDLIARSGTALFVSVDPATRTPAVDDDLAAALRLALDGGVPGGIEPLDWMTSTTPERWRGDGTVVTYDWIEQAGADPFEWGEYNC